jgi:CheY-like chemotaxis protein
MSYKLLLADDSITIQKVVELVLAEEDFQIKSVNNGEDALNLLDSYKPDIVLADIEMPKVNGYNLCEKIKKNPATSHVPVILLRRV